MHGDTPRFRRPILAIIGGTNLGKSLLAADVLRKVASVLGLNPNEAQQDGDADAARQPYVEVTVEESSELDLSDYDLTAIAGVLLDGVGNAWLAASLLVLVCNFLRPLWINLNIMNLAKALL